jgi:hypothetical protein
MSTDRFARLHAPHRPLSTGERFYLTAAMAIALVALLMWANTLPRELGLVMMGAVGWCLRDAAAWISERGG